MAMPSLSRSRFAFVLMALACACTHAADMTPPASASMETLAPAREASKAARWADAIKLLDEAAVKAPKDADVHNLLGYSHRKAGRLTVALKHYKTALTLDPNHKGAHEYIGETYVIMGDMKQAQYHLKELERLCPAGCEEREDLQKAMAAATVKPK
jgi:Flp pilus assembly protein TadD